jgi:O-antigen/teichoic acid export membrane protein
MDRWRLITTSAKGGSVVAGAVLARLAITFVTQVTVARILDPDIFGKLAFATVVAMFLGSFSNLHGDKFVIQHRENPQHALNVAFTLELLAALFFLGIVLVLAPPVMHLLQKPELTIYVQFLALTFFYNPLCRPRCMLEKELMFVQSKLPLVVSQLCGGVIAITLAYYGYGIWSLIWWRLAVPAVEVLILWTIAGRLRLVWDPGMARALLAFGWPLMGSAFLVFFYYNVDYFIVGHFLPNGEEQLGFYWLGFQAGSYLLMSRQVLMDVFFPVFSRIEDEGLKTRAFQLLTRATAGAFLIPTLTVVFFGRDLVLLVYGSKWEPAVLPFQIVFITVLTRVVVANVGYFHLSSGRTRPQFLVAIVFSILLPPAAYWATLTHQINGTAMSVLLVQVIITFFVFERYIKPTTGHGTLYFFLWPWTLSCLALFLAVYSERHALAFSQRLGIFAVLLLIAYVTVFRSVLGDVKSLLQIRGDGR